MNSPITIVRDIDSFDHLDNAWDRMIAERFDGHPFFSHFWFSNYYRSFYAGRPLFVLTDGNDTSLSAALPMVLGRRRMAGIPLKEARYLAGDHSHINRAFVDPHDPDTAAAFIDELIREGVDLVYFEDFPDCFPDRQWLEQFCRDRRFRLETRTVRSSPFIPTAGNFDDYRHILSKKFRELLNNRLNRINRAGGFEIKTYCSPDSVKDAIADMKSISEHSWQTQAKSGLFSNGNQSRFYYNLITHSLEHGYGNIHALYCENRPAAFEFHVIHGKTEYCLKAEYSHECEKVSPGAVLDQELVRRAFESDIEVYDLLGYADSYKLRWTSHQTQYYRYFIFTRSAAAQTAYGLYYRLGNHLRAIKDKLKR